MDLYEPSSGAHVHDLNGGILQSGLFWTLPVDHDALHISDDGREAVLDVDDLQVTDTFQLLSGSGRRRRSACMPSGARPGRR